MSSDNPSETDPQQNSEDPKPSPKPPKKKFKDTRELIRIAIEAGMTQTEIAKICRVQQSIVSKWASGDSKGTEQNLAPLLKRFGSRLSRKTSRVYLAMNDPDPRWENTESGVQFKEALDRAFPAQGKGEKEAEQQLGRVVEQLAAHLGLQLHRGIKWTDLLDFIQVRFTRGYPAKLVTVDGPVIFRHVFSRLDGRLQRTGIEPLRVSVSRWLLHDGLRGKFVLVRQYRRHLGPEPLKHWHSQLARQEAIVVAAQKDRSSAKDFLPSLLSDWLDCADDAGRWACRVERPMAIEELLTFVDDYVQDPLQLHTVHDQRTLPFLLKKALIERRYNVPGVERITDYE